MGTHPIFESDFDCLTDLKMLALAVLLVSSIDIILTFVLKLLKSPSQAHKEILEIDQELKGLSETDDFVKWARLTRRRQELVKENSKSEAAFTASISKTISTVSKLSKLLLFLRTTPIVTLDAEMIPVAFAKALSFTGFGFIRYGDISTFMFYFCTKSFVTCMSSALPTGSAPKSTGIPDILSHLQNPKLD